MSCYVSSNNNRFYVALETAYGVVPGVTGQQRIPGVKLAARQALEETSRRDKSGSRTFVGLPNRIRKRTAFQLNTFMTDWMSGAAAPSHGPLFQAALGGTPLAFAGGTVATTSATTQIAFSAAHGLSVGQAVAHAGEIRFVAGIQNSTTVFLVAPFSGGVAAGTVLGPTLTYPLGSDLGSVSIFDYWDPSDAVQRILNGAAVDSLKVKVNGDFQEFVFAGPAQDLLDSASFTSGQGGLTQFPGEPASADFDYSIVPGHLGQVWMGATPAQFFTLTGAELGLSNKVQLRVKEFGSDFARCIAAGERQVNLNFTVFEMVDAQTAELYQAARQRSPVSVMLQLGEQAGQLFGAYMPAMVPEVPQFDDAETRLQWKFQNSRAQGAVNDELYIAFA
ncbi:MAG: hypothetical protein M3O20_13095 [Acidobacteriota bacterium]|nr:hypothetical protein [Acidobacteriota bacterium]